MSASASSSSGPRTLKTRSTGFRYVGWRDTKLAIVMFVREKGLTAIISKAKTVLESHPQIRHEEGGRADRAPGDDALAR